MLKTLSRKPWSKAIQTPAAEFPLTPLPILSGSIPESLRGTLYRNGPGRLERGGQKVGHWFDGDGAILGVHFTNDGASAVYRYVQTEGYQQETDANQYLYPNYGMTVPGAFWKSWGKTYKNSANTSVLALPDKLLALWEGGYPYKLDLQTLETFGMDDLGGLESGDAFSAHPKIDPVTGEIYNFGVIAGQNTLLKLYRSDGTGKIIQKQAIPLQGLPLIHDFAIAGPYIVFFISPLRVNLFLALAGLRSFGDAFEWKPNLGTQVLIFDRQTLNLVTQNTVEPWFQWHYTNGYVENDGTILVEFVRYEDFQTNQFLKEVSTGETHTLAEGKLTQIRLNPQTGKIINTKLLINQSCDFPVIPSYQVGKQHQNTYLLVHREGVNVREEILGIPAKYNHVTQSLSVANLEKNCYASEPIFVSHSDEQGWILTVVYDGNHHSSEVRIYDSEHLENEPLCRLGLPKIIPPGFHGTWQAAR
jgi:all-trans-8'-apo-beta-carotenal 15,15'-oxygenase